MPSETYKDWIDYYHQKGLSGTDLRQVSGYDHPYAQLTEAGLKNLVGTITELLDLRPDDLLFDVGAGACLLTREISPLVSRIVTIDPNSTMLKHGPLQLERIQAVSNSIPFPDRLFDKVLCHSVMQYYPSLKYSESSVREKLRVTKPNGLILIMDLPDFSKKEEYLEVKGQDSHNLQRLYYEKEWFEDNFANVSILEPQIADYKNSQYRFSVLIRK